MMKFQAGVFEKKEENIFPVISGYSQTKKGETEYRENSSPVVQKHIRNASVLH